MAMDIQTATIIYNNIVLMSCEQERETIFDAQPTDSKTIVLKLHHISCLWSYKSKLISRINSLYASVEKKQTAAMGMNYHELESLFDSASSTTRIIQKIRMAVPLYFELFGIPVSNEQIFQLQRKILDSECFKKIEETKNLVQSPETVAIFSPLLQFALECAFSMDILDADILLGTVETLRRNPAFFDSAMEKLGIDE
jgi:hypothetical protein